MSGLGPNPQPPPPSAGIVQRPAVPWPTQQRAFWAAVHAHPSPHVDPGPHSVRMQAGRGPNVGRPGSGCGPARVQMWAGQGPDVDESTLQTSGLGVIECEACQS